MSLLAAFQPTSAATEPGGPIQISPHLFDAAIFDLDGVVTRTARVHALAWKRLFDGYLQERSARDGQEYTPFDIEDDYLRYVDGKPRHEGVRSFLESRGIVIPYGQPGDPPGAETVCGLGNRKNPYFQESLAAEGVEVFESSVRLIQQLHREGLKTAVVSASKNCRYILEKAGLTEFFDIRVDGQDAEEKGLKGKPAPDTFLEAARKLDVTPKRSIVVEDALAGVEAGRAGEFGLVIGVNRANQAEALYAAGAELVVSDLSEIALGKDGIFKTEEVEKAIDFTSEPRDHWRLVYDDFDPEKEGMRETLCALGNGYFVTRGAAPESVDDGIHYPGTYIAGGYNRLKTEAAGRLIEHEDLVNFPNWLPLTFRVDGGQWFSLDAVEILSYRQELDLKKGVLHRRIRFRDAYDRITLMEESRFVHLREFHLAGLQTRLTSENWSGRLEIRSALDGRVINNNLKHNWYVKKKHHTPLENRVIGDGILFLKVETLQSELRVAQAARTLVYAEGRHPLPLTRRNIEEQGYVAQEMDLQLYEGNSITIEKMVSMYTSRDHAISEAGSDALRFMPLIPRFDEMLRTHAEAWNHLWSSFDIETETLEDNQINPPGLVLHLHIFHLLQTASCNSIDLDIGIPARGWTGEGYQGHVFWDDLFAFPFLSIRMPEIAESVLKYRYRRLDMARGMATQAGLKGALYPWESASSGIEETPPVILDIKTRRWIPINTFFQKHVNAAIAHNIWHYYQVTNDIEFMNSYGAEILLEIARLFASLSTYNPELDRYEIRHVMGPDEYHDGYPGQRGTGIHNNSYTNIMAVWVLCRAMEVLDVMPADHRQKIFEKLDLQEEELSLWHNISRKMRIVLLPDGIISQFEGYENLEEFPANRTVQEVLEANGGELNAYKISKQADVLMLFYLFSSEELVELFARLGYHFDPRSIPRNIDYYLNRTVHGSTLSRIAHAWVLSRADRPRSWRLFREALQSDVADTHDGSTSEGVHIGAMAGTVDILQRAYTGLVTRDDVLWLNPCLPDMLTRMSFCIHYRQQSLRIELSHEHIKVMARYSAAKPIKFGFQETVHTLDAGAVLELDFKPHAGCCHTSDIKQVGG